MHKKKKKIYHQVGIYLLEQIASDWDQRAKLNDLQRLIEVGLHVPLQWVPDPHKGRRPELIVNIS